MDGEIETGYDGYEKTPEGPEEAEYHLEKVPFHWSGNRIAAQLMRGNVSIGLIYPPTEEEFQWLRRRINGTFRSETESGSQRKENRRTMPDFLKGES